jgi:CheY-like chemotaxis protein
MGGSICVESQVGRGTTFKIYLPRLQEARGNGTGAPAAAAASSVAGGTEVILLVEENAVLREMAATVLEKQGYSVHRAATGSEAISSAVGIPSVDLLIADPVRTKVTGRELAHWLCPSRPMMKVLLTSASDGDKARGLPNPGASFLRKPYTPGALSRKVREALDGDLPFAASVSPGGPVAV